VDINTDCSVFKLRNKIISLQFANELLHVMYDMSFEHQFISHHSDLVGVIGVKCFLPSCVYYLKLYADIKKKL